MEEYRFVVVIRERVLIDGLIDPIPARPAGRCRSGVGGSILLHRRLCGFTTKISRFQVEYPGSQSLPSSCFVAKINQFSSQNPPQPGWGSVDWRLNENPMFEATFHPNSQRLSCNHGMRKRLVTIASLGMSPLKAKRTATLPDLSLESVFGWSGAGWTEVVTVEAGGQAEDLRTKNIKNRALTPFQNIISGGLTPFTNGDRLIVGCEKIPCSKQPSIQNFGGSRAITGCGRGLCPARPRGCLRRRPNGPRPFLICR